jgi:hypothetical protein
MPLASLDRADRALAQEFDLVDDQRLISLT